MPRVYPLRSIWDGFQQSYALTQGEPRVVLRSQNLSWRAQEPFVADAGDVLDSRYSHMMSIITHETDKGRETWVYFMIGSDSRHAEDGWKLFDKNAVRASGAIPAVELSSLRIVGIATDPVIWLSLVYRDAAANDLLEGAGRFQLLRDPIIASVRSIERLMERYEPSSRRCRIPNDRNRRSQDRLAKSARLIASPMHGIAGFTTSA